MTDSAKLKAAMKLLRSLAQYDKDVHYPDFDCPECSVPRDHDHDESCPWAWIRKFLKEAK